MNTSIKVGAALLLSGILIATTLPRKAGAQGQPRQPMWTVVIEGTIAANGELVVGYLSRSKNAPIINPGDSLGESLNLLQEQNGQVAIHNNAWGPLTYTVSSRASVN